MAADVVALADHLEHDQISIVGEDWGAAIAYAAAAFHRDRVRQLVFQEMRLPGVELPRPDTPLSSDDPRTGWHFSFFNVARYPELLMAGRERDFWSTFVRSTMADPSAATEEDLDEMVHSVERPGGLHTILSVYRAAATDAEQNRQQMTVPLDIPVLAVGGSEYLADEPRQHMTRVAQNVRGVVIEGCGHNPSLEAPARLAAAYLDFLT